jgi:hypothetical protein
VANFSVMARMKKAFEIYEKFSQHNTSHHIRGDCSNDINGRELQVSVRVTLQNLPLTPNLTVAVWILIRDVPS